MMDMRVIINSLKYPVSRHDAVEFCRQRMRAIRDIYVTVTNNYEVCILSYVKIIKVFTDMV